MPFDCLGKVTVQFLPTDTNWKNETLDKNLFILDPEQMIAQFHPPTGAFSYLFKQVLLIGYHETTLVLICVH